MRLQLPSGPIAATIKANRPVYRARMEQSRAIANWLRGKGKLPDKRRLLDIQLREIKYQTKAVSQPVKKARILGAPSITDSRGTSANRETIPRSGLGNARTSKKELARARIVRPGNMVLRCLAP